MGVHARAAAHGAGPLDHRQTAYPSGWLPDVVLPLPATLSFAGLGPHVTSLPEAFVMMQGGAARSAGQNWASLVLHLRVDLLDISVFGHLAVAGARMAGFKALRNTHRPLESRSIADFWNRYYFYFKELLVDFFFLPTYLRWFKAPTAPPLLRDLRRRRRRNFIFHWLAEPVDIATLGLGLDRATRNLRALRPGARAGHRSVAVAQTSRRCPEGDAPRASHLARVATTSGVLLFYCLLQILNVAPLGSSAGDCSIFLSLFHSER